MDFLAGLFHNSSPCEEVCDQAKRFFEKARIPPITNSPNFERSRSFVEVIRISPRSLISGMQSWSMKGTGLWIQRSLGEMESSLLVTTFP